MYFPDLTPYCYRLPFSLDRVRCVGWLASPHQFIQGSVSLSCVEQLKALILCRTSTFDVHVNVVRGIRPCRFCNDEIVINDDVGRKGFLGMSELWIPSMDGYFAAPSLVYHYMAAHDYCPPEIFCRAILEMQANEPYSGQHVYDDFVMKIMKQRTRVS